MGRWLLSLDAASRAAALLCALPTVLLYTIGPGEIDTDRLLTSAERVDSLLLAVPAAVAMIPIVAAPQFGLFWLVRQRSVSWLKWTFCAASALLLFPYARYLATADLTSTSTAAVGAVFYPLMLAAMTLPVAWLVWWLARDLPGR